MNLFVLDLNPIKAAQYHSDKHAVKMILEAAQLMSTAHRVLDGDQVAPEIYQKTHVNHPCAIWVRENSANYKWTVELFAALLDEYEKRYQRTHACRRLMSALKKLPQNIFKTTHRSPFALAMPEEYHNPDAVKAYRDYYFFDDHKRRLNVWRHCPMPEWYRKLIKNNPNLKIN